MADTKKEKKNKPETGSNEAKETLMRVQAEFENYIKRAEKQVYDARKQGCADVMAKMLPLIDSLDAAVENAGKAKEMNVEDAVKGLEGLREQALAVFKENGVKAMDCVGKKFDSDRHDALMTGDEKESEEGIVLEELQKGYVLNDMVLRHAKVKVNKIEGGN